MSWKSKLSGLPANLLAHTEKAIEGRMAANPTIKDVLLKGTQLHVSHDGSGNKVISVQMLNEFAKRVETIHVQEDGTTDVKKKDR